MGNSEKKRQFGISGHRRQNDIEVHLWKLGVMLRCRLMPTAMKLKPMKGRKYLD
jgi:hypothetical protein